MADPHADGRRVQPAAVGDEAVADRVVRDEPVAVVGDQDRGAVADLDAAGAQVVHLAVLARVVLAAGPEVIGVAAGAANRAPSKVQWLAPTAVMAAWRLTSACGKLLPLGR